MSTIEPQYIHLNNWNEIYNTNNHQQNINGDYYESNEINIDDDFDRTNNTNDEASNIQYWVNLVILSVFSLLFSCLLASIGYIFMNDRNITDLLFVLFGTDGVVIILGIMYGIVQKCWCCCNP